MSEITNTQGDDRKAVTEVDRSLTIDEILDWIDESSNIRRLLSVSIAITDRLRQLGYHDTFSEFVPRGNANTNSPQTTREIPQETKQEEPVVKPDSPASKVTKNVHGQSVLVIPGTRQTVQKSGTPTPKPGKPGHGSVKTLLRKVQGLRAKLRKATEEGDTDMINSTREALDAAEERLKQARDAQINPDT